VNTTPIHWEANGGGIYANNISNRDPWGDTARAGTGILMASPSTNVTIMGNYLHQCGQLPRNNHEHCIYNSNMDGGAITDNLIYDSADRGIQNASDPNGVTETGNLVVDTHDTGINLGATASNNAISHNVVVFSDDLNFDTAPDYTDTGNSFTDNCSYQSDGTSGIGSTGNVTLAYNVTADPQLTTDWAAGTATVGNSTCAAKLPAGSRFAP
jgi:hypothetical protein